jgi:hypothetical protein
MRSFAPVELIHHREDAAERWLVCMEAQRAFFSPREDASATSLYAKVETCRRLLAYARRSHWQVVHVHLRQVDTAKTPAPDIRPIEGLEPLPRERVYFRQLSRPLTLHDDPFWRDISTGGRIEALTIGHLSERAVQAVTSTADELGICMLSVADAIWHGPSDPLPAAVQTAPWRTNRSVDSRQAMANQALSVVR